MNAVFFVDARVALDPYIHTIRSKFELLLLDNPVYNGQECWVRQRQDGVWDPESGGDTHSLVTAYTGHPGAG